MNVVKEYDYYTLDQAREIIYAEMRHDRALRSRKRRLAAAQKEAEKRKRIEDLKLAILLFFYMFICPALLYIHWFCTYQEAIK